MFKLNRKVEYALIALKHMSQKAPGKLTTAKEICEAYHTPFDPTARVLQLMVQQNILRAEQGVYGGYQITKDLSKVSLGQLYAAIEGPLEISSCIISGHLTCDINKSCTLMGPIRKLNEKIAGLFYTIKLAEFLELR